MKRREAPRLQAVPPIGDGEAHHAWASVDYAQSLPAAPALLIVRLVKRWNISSEQLLEPLGLREELLEEPFARISIAAKRALIERARELTRERGLGFYLGLEMRATNYGYLGFAALSAGTVGEALELTCQFLPCLTRSFDLRLEVDGDHASLVLDMHADFGSAEDVFIIGAVVGLWHIASVCTGTPLRGVSELPFREPDYYWRFAHLLPRARFEQPVTRLIFDASILALPIVSADRAALRLARAQCQAALDSLDGENGLAEHVRRLVARSRNAPGSVTEVATALHVSTRTLKRKLAAQGVSFSELLAEARRDTALRLLAKSSLSVDAIAKRLGYSSAPNFTRAFRRWLGETPSEYRQFQSNRRQA